MDRGLSYPTIVNAPTESEPWNSLEPILPGSEILMVRKAFDDGKIGEICIELPAGAQYVSIEELEGCLYGTFKDSSCAWVGKFTVQPDSTVVDEETV